MTIRKMRAAAVALAVCLPGLAQAQGAAPAAMEGATRPRLTQEQRDQARDQARQRWQAMSPDERQKALEERRARRAEAEARMTPEERAAMRQRAAERRAQARPVTTN